MTDAGGSALRLCVLGPLELRLAGAVVPVGGRKQRAVLALLALRANRIVPVDDLIEAVWGEAPPSRPTAVLQVYAANIRKLLEPQRAVGARSTRLSSSSSGYSLQVTEDELDVLVLDGRLAAARSAADRGDLHMARDELRAATALWRGGAFPDLLDVPDLQPELGAVEERRLRAWEDLLELDLAVGEHGSVIAETADLIARYPFRERLWAARVLGLWRSQRQAEALQACRAARTRFLDDLGADPGPLLRELEQAVLRQDPTLDRSAASHSPVQQGRLSTLPAPLTGLIGRVQEREDLVGLLRSGQARLITLTGPGGIGKTRLALAAAHDGGASFVDGVCWVALDRLTRADQVLETVAAALDVPMSGVGGLQERVGAFLKSRRLLLLLDNFEQVLDAWPVVVALLSSAPGLTVMVTSRSRLEVTGEQVYAVPPLSLPGLQPAPSASSLQASEAASLFLERARLADHRYHVSQDDAEPLARICHRLDGLPLALELAAAHVTTFSTAALLTALNDALGVLTGGPRDVTDRQRTLRGAIAWSFDLLPDSVRSVFTALGVFSSAPELTAIAAVLDRDQRESLPESLQSLARASLVRIVDGAAGTRIDMLHTVRDFAVQRLSSHPQAETYRERHARHYVELAETTGPALGGPTQVQAFQRLSTDGPEFDRALDWAVGTGRTAVDGELAMRLIGALWHYWEIAGHVDAPRRLGERLLAGSDQRPSQLTGSALVGVGTLSWLAGDYSRATVLHRQAVEHYELAGDVAGLAWALMCLAAQEGSSGQMADAERHARASLQLARQSNAPRTCACAHSVLGVLALSTGESAKAEHHDREALTLARQVGDRWLASVALVNLADVAYSSGQYAETSAHLREALDMAADMRDRHVAVYAVEAAAELALRHEHHRRAVHLLAAAARWRSERGQPLDDLAQRRLDTALQQARAAVGAVTFAVLWAEGRRLDLDDAVAQARAAE